ncbi:hypothetical protein DFP72DRAFT_1070553 [Ephemerocybe angulata]|uniref:Uncharacterized protein n=1 Tax=Ephemerocybe angulata TaxID=980116 RepID=A0A8H6M5L0_9AGAR|nr:hypothetical protein DFP72DRAFT_1070553 [Tulosesus angulatus]
MSGNNRFIHYSDIGVYCERSSGFYSRLSSSATRRRCLFSVTSRIVFIVADDEQLPVSPLLNIVWTVLVVYPSRKCEDQLENLEAEKPGYAVIPHQDNRTIRSQIDIIKLCTLSAASKPYNQHHLSSITMPSHSSPGSRITPFTVGAATYLTSEQPLRHFETLQPASLLVIYAPGREDGHLTCASLCRAIPCLFSSHPDPASITTVAIVVAFVSTLLKTTLESSSTTTTQPFAVEDASVGRPFDFDSPAASSKPPHRHHETLQPASLVPLVTLQQVSSSLANGVDRWRRRLLTGLWHCHIHQQSPLDVKAVLPRRALDSLQQVPWSNPPNHVPRLTFPVYRSILRCPSTSTRDCDWNAHHHIHQADASMLRPTIYGSLAPQLEAMVKDTTPAPSYIQQSASRCRDQRRAASSSIP